MDHSPNSLQDLDGSPKLKNQRMTCMLARMHYSLCSRDTKWQLHVDLELNIGEPEGDIKDIIVNMSLLNDLTVKVARRFTVIPEAFLNESVPDTGDRVYSYAQVLCHFATVVHLFTDTCKEGDGERVIRCWKLCIFHFHAERRRNMHLRL